MRFSVAAFTLFGVLATASASTFQRRQASLPACAVTCISQANFDGCNQTDNSCLCKSQKFVDSTTTCITSTCKGDDLTNAIAAAQALCASVGVTLTGSPSSSATGGSSSSAPASSATSTAPSGTSKTASGSSAASSGTSSAPPAATSKTSGASSHGVNGLAGLAAIGLVALAL